MAERVFGQTGAFDLTNGLSPGVNTVEILFENVGAGWTYGYRIRTDGTVVAQETCGQPGVQGCAKNDSTLGVTFSRQYRIVK